MLEYTLAHANQFKVINYKGLNGQTALMFLARLSNFPSALRWIQNLAEYGADLNAQDNAGKFVLDYAKDPKVVSLLVKLGAHSSQ